MHAKKVLWPNCILFGVLWFLVDIHNGLGQEWLQQQRIKDFARIDLPFQYINDLIVVDVIFNRSVPLRFIFDTGAEHTILTKREITDLLRLPYRRVIRIRGADMSQDLFAYLVTDVHLEIEERLHAANQAILVLDDDYFRFDELTGLQIHGILGADVFKQFVVRINYQRQLITLFRVPHFKPPRHNTEIVDLDIYKNKPYLYVKGRLPQSDMTLQLKLLVDTGAGLPILLNIDTHPLLKLPPNTVPGNIGAGLGGFLQGYVGRLEELHIGPFALYNVLTNFQQLHPDADTSFLHGRHGILGNQLLSRFVVYIDYSKGKLYLQPTKQLNKPFEFDRSGLLIIASGPLLNHYTVHYVVPGSPAHLAGIQQGDEIVRIGIWPAELLSLQGINKILRKKPGKKVHITYRRNGQKHRVTLTLRDLI